MSAEGAEATGGEGVGGRCETCGWARGHAPSCTVLKPAQEKFIADVSALLSPEAAKALDEVRSGDTTRIHALMDADPLPEATGGEGVTLSKAEREVLNRAQFLTPPTLEDNPVHAAVERIVAARVQQAEGPPGLLDAAVAAANRYKAERDALRERVEALADELDGEYDPGYHPLVIRLRAALDG